MHTPFATLLGYDAAVLKHLSPAEVRTLDRLVEAWLLSCLLFACPVGYALWLIEHSLLLSALAALGTFVLVLLLLRLSVAGGGAAPHFSPSELAAWTPALGPTAILTLLALLLSQPAQLPLWRAELAPLISAHRADLAAERQALSDSLALKDLPHDHEALAHSEFLVLRLQSIWNIDAPRALRLTFFYALLVMQPALWARLFGLSALRAYERARSLQMRRLIQSEARLTETRARAELAKWSR